MRLLLAAIVSILLAACSGETDRAAATIEAGSLHADVMRLASDEMEGRAPGTPGDRLAREYLIRRLEEIGCIPGGEDESWEQHFSIVGMRTRLPETWEFRDGRGGRIAFRRGIDYMGATGVQREGVEIRDAELVFVGYGIQAPEYGWDDYKTADLRGKILLMLNDDPDWEESLFAGERKLYYGRWTCKYESAARQGAAGAVIVHTTASAGYNWEVVRTSWSGEQYEVPADGGPRTGLQAWMTGEAAERLVSLAGRDLQELVESARSREFEPVPLGVLGSIAFKVQMRSTGTANVLGLLPGSDPALAGQVVVYTAHHDHLGTGDPDETGDRIYNGALDNSVAMAQALAVASAFNALPERPRRSILFLFPAAEEQGLLGSRYYTLHPTFPPARIAANINFELGNIWGRTRDITIFGMGKSTLEDMLAEAARKQGRTVHPEKTLRAGWFYRSDQFSFARIGVPAIWYRSGDDFKGRPEGWGAERYAAWIEEHYHRPSDEVREDWNYEGLVDDARLGFLLGLKVAQSDGLPDWYPGDEFEEVRKRALAGSKRP